MQYGLKHGDTLLVGGSVVDPCNSNLDFGAKGVAEVHFFRADRTAPLQMVTPLYNVPGFSLPQRIRLDVMHVADLGTTARYIGTVLRRSLDAGVFGYGVEAWDRGIEKGIAQNTKINNSFAGCCIRRPSAGRNRRLYRISAKRQ